MKNYDGIIERDFANPHNQTTVNENLKALRMQGLKEPSRATDKENMEKLLADQRVDLNCITSEDIRRELEDPFSNHDPRTYAEFLRATGCRSREVCELKVKDVDLKQCIATLSDQHGHPLRLVFFPQEVSVLLERYLQHRAPIEGPLFFGRTGKRLTVSEVHRIIRPWGKPYEQEDY